MQDLNKNSICKENIIKKIVFVQDNNKFKKVTVPRLLF
jgi:hypothetical protein